MGADLPGMSDYLERLGLGEPEVLLKLRVITDAALAEYQTKVKAEQAARKAQHGA